MSIAYALCPVILIISILNSSKSDLATLLSRGVPEEFVNNHFDVDSDFSKHEVNTSMMVRQGGRACEELDVFTQDGYVLNMVHILNEHNSQDLPIIMMHGYMDSTDTFTLKRETSPAVDLADSGYDVWLPNMRGNRYSRRHIKLDPDVDKEYWDFSFHEFGYYDFPAIIDKVLERTGKSQVILITHSLGGTNFMVMGSTRQEYNDKIKVSINLAPIYYQQHYRGLAAAAPVVYPAAYKALAALGKVEMINQNNVLRRIIQKICTELKEISYDFCLYTFVFPILGFDTEQTGPEMIPEILGHYFAGSSVKTVGHAAQFVHKHYGQFDYGPSKNFERYGSATPPLYNLTNISCKVVIMVGRNDLLSPPPDGIALWKAIPNATYFEMPLMKFNHIDFVWGSEMRKYFFPYLHKILKKYK